MSSVESSQGSSNELSHQIKNNVEKDQPVNSSKHRQERKTNYLRSSKTEQSNHASPNEDIQSLNTDRKGSIKRLPHASRDKKMREKNRSKNSDKTVTNGKLHGMN